MKYKIAKMVTPVGLPTGAGGPIGPGGGPYPG
jgi:hypothetical protein